MLFGHEPYIEALRMTWDQLKEWWELFMDALFNRPEDIFWADVNQVVVK